MADRYIDFTKSSGTLTGTWTFTNGSATVNAGGADGNALAEVAVGNYIRQSDGTQWYKVTAVPDDDNITITPVFQQATHTDDAGASLHNSEDGTAIGQAFCHPNQYTTDEVRTAGDTGKMRANQTHVLSGIDITFDEDGTVDSYIILKGCDSVDDPWSDGSDIRPILDFGGTAFQVNLSSDYYWKVSFLDFKESHDSNGALYMYVSYGSVVTDCRFYDNGNVPTHAGLKIASSIGVLIENCLFDNNSGYSILLSSTLVNIDGCSFDGDGDNAIGSSALGTAFGIYQQAGRLYIKNSVFGGDANGAHSSSDLRMVYSAEVLGRNVKLNSPTEVYWVSSLNTGVVSLEDDEQTHEAFRAFYNHGTISKTAVVERSGDGGTAWSILGEPNSNCGANTELYLIGDWLRGIPIYLDGTEQTITIYAYATSWAALPSVSEFVVELEHYEGAADWEIDATSDTFAANDQWESFAITLTPGAAGPAYLRVYLKDYEDGTEKIYVDPKPVIS